MFCIIIDYNLHLPIVLTLLLISLFLDSSTVNYFSAQIKGLKLREKQLSGGKQVNYACAAILI